MKEYILSIAGIVLLSSVVTVIAPGGQTGKFIRGMTRLLCLLVFLAPLASLAEGKWEFASADIAADESYLVSCEALCERSESLAIGNYLSAEYGVEAVAEVDCDANSAFSVKNIRVIVEDFGINPPEKHIDIIARIQSGLAPSSLCCFSLPSGASFSAARRPPLSRIRKRNCA